VCPEPLPCPPEDVVTFRIGDVNGDLEIDLSDAVYLSQPFADLVPTGWH